MSSLHSPFVLDASIAVKWFFNDEPLAVDAKNVLADLIEKPKNFIVPMLFFIEVSAVLIKKTKWDSKFTERALTHIYDLGIVTIPFGKTLHDEAISIAHDYKISFYDAIYVSTAKAFNGRWLTADIKATTQIPATHTMLLKDYATIQ